MRLNSYHDMLLKEMSREVNHMWWERLTLEPSQGVGFGCSGGSGYINGVELENQDRGNWNFLISSVVLTTKYLL